jgi:hypothetical protein
MPVRMARALMAALAIAALQPATGGAQTRRGLLGTRRPVSREAGPAPVDHSFFTIGTMLGVTYAVDDQTTYHLVDGAVVVRERGDGFDRVLPAAYVLPSLALYGTPGGSLSAIVPLGLSPGGETAVGFGLSWGFNVLRRGRRAAAEVGISLLLVWTEATRLTAAQRASLEAGTPLPAGESSTFPSKRRPSFGLGIYIAPLL